jgi:hypothetical protein
MSTLELSHPLEIQQHKPRDGVRASILRHHDRRRTTGTKNTIRVFFFLKLGNSHVSVLPPTLSCIRGLTVSFLCESFPSGIVISQIFALLFRLKNTVKQKMK